MIRNTNGTYATDALISAEGMTSRPTPNMKIIKRASNVVRTKMTTENDVFPREPYLQNLIKRLPSLEDKFDYASQIYYVQAVNPHTEEIIWDKSFFEVHMTKKEEFRKPKFEKLARNIILVNGYVEVEFKDGMAVAEWLRDNGYVSKTVTLESCRASVYRACRIAGTLYAGFEFKYGNEGVK